ncbi:MAG: AraC family transcriptional regulator [Lentisphaerae bacterium]|nr:MAG: AraC family transcriptional regulator [Lentisphaerota bacterium]
MVRGTIRVACNRQLFVVSRGEACIIPPATLHWSQAISEDVHRVCLHFDWSHSGKPTWPPFVFVAEGHFQRELAKTMSPPLPQPCLANSLELTLINQYLSPIRTVWNKQPPSLELQLRAQIAFRELLLCVLAQTAPIQPAQDTGKAFILVQKLKQYLEQHFRDPALDMRMVARVHHITPEYLSTLFCDHLGISPLQYLHQLRIRDACALLETNTTNLSISEIAAKVGIPNLTWFSRLFRRHTGMTPTQYAAAQLEEARPKKLDDSQKS